MALIFVVNECNQARERRRVMHLKQPPRASGKRKMRASFGSLLIATRIDRDRAVPDN